MHVEVVELHDGVLIAECGLSNVGAFIASGFSVLHHRAQVESPK
jgi:hypothetical protein